MAIPSPSMMGQEKQKLAWLMLKVMLVSLSLIRQVTPYGKHHNRGIDDERISYTATGTGASYQF